MSNRRKKKKLKQAKARNKEANKKSSAAQPCPNTAPCTFDSFVIHCGHSERAYSLDILTNPETEANKHLLRVIDHPHGSETVSVNFSGSCGKGNDHQCPQVKVYCNDASPPVNETHNATFEFQANSANEAEEWSLKKFLLHALVPTGEVFNRVNSYSLTASGCNGAINKTVIVESWKKITWQGQLSLGYHPVKSFGDDDQLSNFTSDTSNGWNMEGEIALSIAEETWQLKGGIDDLMPGFQDKFDSVLSWFNELKIHTDEQGKVASNTGLLKPQEMVTMEFDWPNLVLSGEVTNEEIEQDYALDLKGEVKLAFDPFIGATISTDILEWALRYFVGFGEFIVLIKRWAASDIEDDTNLAAQVVVQLLLKGEGKISGELSWSKQPGDGLWSIAGDKGASVTGELGLSLEGKIHGEARVFYVTAAAGVTITVSGADDYSGIGLFAKLAASNEDDKPAIAGTMGFTGLKVSGAHYYEYGIKRASADEQPSEQTSSKSRRGAQSANKKVKHDKTFFTKDPSTWLSTDKTDPIDQAVTI